MEAPTIYGIMFFGSAGTAWLRARRAPPLLFGVIHRIRSFVPRLVEVVFD